MKKIAFMMTFIWSVNSVAATVHDDPYEKFSVNNNKTNSVKVEWEYTANVSETCNAIRVNNGQQPYPYNVQACSKWHTNAFGQTVCTITTSYMVSMWTLGHEMRHCFQGDFHNEK